MIAPSVRLSDPTTCTGCPHRRDTPLYRCELMPFQGRGATGLQQFINWTHTTCPYRRVAGVPEYGQGVML